MCDWPRGTVTFLMSDVEGSTALWEQHRAVMLGAITRHIDLLRTAIEAHHGVLFKVVGDSVQAAFPTAPDGVGAALAAQRDLLAEPWPPEIARLRVRIALHTGQAEPDVRGDYLAPPLNRLSRLLGASHGGQIVLSHAAQQLARDDLPAGAALRDLGEHRLRDLAASERVFQLLHPDLTVDFPPLATLDRRVELPRAGVPLIGRDRDVAAVIELLGHASSSVVTLTGPGGVGKTHLALNLAHRLAADFADGVTFVDLAPIRDTALVLPSIARAVQMPAVGDQALPTSLAAFLVPQRRLLVLDNCEQVVGAAPQVAELVAACPGVRILATSRAPFGIRAERVYPVEPLAVPSAATDQPLAALAAMPSVTLFVERAAAVSPSFTLTTANAAAVAAVCRQLDGLPLAIELAAARTKLFSPAALLSRLETRLPLLGSGPRDAPERQRTLRDAIAWSHELLHVEEQVLFRRLAVFVGGWSIDAVEAVTGDSTLTDVLPSLEALINQSLVRRADGNSDEPRFALLETIREFAAELLAESSEEAAVRARHADWYMAFATGIGPRLEGPHQIDMLAHLDAELGNLRAAIHWLLQSGAADRVLRIAIALESYWWARGLQAEVGPWIVAALEGAPDANPADRALALHVLSVAAAWAGDIDAALTHAEAGVRVAADASNPYILGQAYLGLGHAWEWAGDGIVAAEQFEAAIPLLRQGEDPHNFLPTTLANLASAFLWGGQVARAAACAAEAVERYEAAGDRWGLSYAFAVDGYVAGAQDQHARAASSFLGALAAAEDVGERRALIGAVVGIAGLMLARDEGEGAARLLGAAEAAREAAGVARVGWPLLAKQVHGACRERLGEDVFVTNYLAGQEMDWGEAVAVARAGAEVIATD